MPFALHRNRRKRAPTRSLTIMDGDPSAQIQWRRTKAVIERRVTVADRCASVSLQLDEMTVVAMREHACAAPDTCVDLELGAYVARMRTGAATRPDTALDHRCSRAISRWAPAILESD